MRRVAAVAVLAAALAAPASAAPAVAAVRVEADGPVDAARVVAILGLERGRPLDRARLARGIRVLWATGEVDDVAVLASEAPGGLEVIVRVGVAPRVGRVRIVGVGWRWRLRIAGWLGVEGGERFDAGRIETEAERVRRRLADLGYLAARVEPWAQLDRATMRVGVTLAVTPGEPARPAGLEVTGVEAADELAGAVRGVVVGHRLTASRRRRVETRLLAALARRGYLRAEVRLRAEPAPGGLRLVAEVEPGPRYEVELDCPEDLAPGVLELVREAEDPEATDALEDAVVARLRRLGHPLAVAEATLAEGPDGGRVLRLRVRPGPRGRLLGVRFPGASLDPETLARAAAIGGPRVPPPDALERARERVLEAYRRAGYADAVVGRPRVVAAPGGGAVVELPVEREGPRVTVAELEVAGLPPEVAPPPVPPGAAEEGPWDPRALPELRRRLEAALADAGYPDARVEVTWERERRDRVAVRARVAAGPPVRVGEVVVSGLERTAESVVRNVLRRAGVREGAPYSLAALLDARRRLYELALFRRVDLLPLPGDEGRARRGVLVRCEEAPQRSYVAGVGWDTEARARVTLGWSHLNLLGHAHALSAEVRLSGREQRYQLTLREPEVLGLGVPGFLSAYRTEERFASFSQLRRGMWAEVGDRRRRPLRLWLRYEYQIVRPEAPPEVLSRLERTEREIQIASLTSTLEWDTRDDPLDPRRGALASLALEVAFPAFKADASFVKLEGRAAGFAPLAGGTGAVGFRAGAIVPYGGGTGPGNLRVPIGARFFAGGRISHRAFPIDRLGVPGQTLDPRGDPVGGDALLVLNVEYRRPVRGPLEAEAFLDAGNVWAEPGLVDLGQVRWGVGVGLRYRTPAGPLRLEYGVKLDRRRGESPGELYLSFGTAF